jgi:hypothetical protein
MDWWRGANEKTTPMPPHCPGILDKLLFSAAPEEQFLAARQVFERGPSR